MASCRPGCASFSRAPSLLSPPAARRRAGPTPRVRAIRRRKRLPLTRDACTPSVNLRCPPLRDPASVRASAAASPAGPDHRGTPAPGIVRERGRCRHGQLGWVRACPRRVLDRERLWPRRCSRVLIAAERLFTRASCGHCSTLKNRLGSRSVIQVHGFKIVVPALRHSSTPVFHDSMMTRASSWDQILFRHETDFGSSAYGGVQAAKSHLQPPSLGSSGSSPESKRLSAELSRVVPHHEVAIRRNDIDARVVGLAAICEHLGHDICRPSGLVSRVRVAGITTGSASTNLGSPPPERRPRSSEAGPCR